MKNFFSSFFAPLSGAQFGRRLAASVATVAMVFGLASCTKTPETDPVPAGTYSIRMASVTHPEVFEVLFDEEAKAGEQVEVSIVEASAGIIEIVEVSANGLPCEFVSVDGPTTVYKFTMPEKNVLLLLDYKSSITVVGTDICTGVADKRYAAAGETVTVNYTVSDIRQYVSGATFNGSPCTQVDNNRFSFRMPDVPVTVEPQFGDLLLLVTEKSDEHSDCVVLNCYYEDGNGGHYHAAGEGVPVNFYYVADWGYDVSVHLVGDRSGRDYTSEIFESTPMWYYPSDGYISTWSFFMPAESVTIDVVSTERSDYAGQPFLGTYHGFWIEENIDNHVYTSSQPTLTAELCANGVYTLESTDANAYNATGLYTHSGNRIGFVQQGGVKFGLEGDILSDDLIFGDVRDLRSGNDKPDNTHFYMLCRNDVSFVRATGAFRDRCYLVEITEGSKQSWFVADVALYKIYPAEAEFSRGTTLGEVSTAILTFEAAPYAIRYTLDNAGGKPTVEYAGSERGTYTGSGDKLFLDGFGGAAFGSVKGSYTIAGIEVTFKPESGDAIVFHITQGTMTYEKIVNTESWDGPMHFSTSGGKANGYGGDVFVELYLDRDFSMAEAKGKAKLTMRVGGNSLADNTVEYTYNADNNTIILAYSYVYYANDAWVDDNALVLKVGDDKKTLTFEQEYVSIFACRGYAWILGGDQTVLTAEQ